jgi:hypothetical protein
MNKVARKLVVLAGAGVGAGIARRARSRRQANDQNGGARWLTVTVYRPIGEVEGHLPTVITDLGDLVELRLRQAPGDRGTELAAKLNEGYSDSGFLKRLAGRDPSQEVRTALREAKSLLEAGEIIHADTPPSTHPGLGGKVLEFATERAGGEGRL